jgi:glutathione synthase/RimK-type ligase-like ATP-grasp enzyme
MGSKSARVLRDALGTKLIRIRNTRFRPRADDIVINWGSGMQLFHNRNYLNNPSAVLRATNKLLTLESLLAAEVNVPEFTTRQSVAQRWVDDGSTVVARRLLRGCKGRGIEMCAQGTVVPTAPLYTKYVPKYDEYRVHVMGGQVIDIQQKRRRHNVEANSQIRNERHGWVFCRQDVNCPEVVAEAGVRAVAALGLDFGGCDIGFTRRGSVATVYEVNTAPGIEATSLDTYSASLLNLIRGRR